MIWLEAYDLILVTTYEGTPGWDAPDNFVDGTDIESDPHIVPPAGRLQPTRGFGKVWRESPVSAKRWDGQRNLLHFIRPMCNVTL